jgi:Kef-type K+ transport system membrane component KefB
MNDFFGFLDKLPILNSRKSPIGACIIGLFFGSIGVGIYLQSLTDFLIPLLVFIVLAVIIPGFGALPGWIFAGLYGYFRVVNSNERRSS